MKLLKAKTLVIVGDAVGRDGRVAESTHLEPTRDRILDELDDCNHCRRQEKNLTQGKLRSASSVISRGLQVPPNEAKKTNDRRAQACPSMTTAKAGDVSPWRSRRWRRACQVLELHRIRTVFSPLLPPGRRGGIIAAQAYFISCTISYRTVSYRLVSYRCFKGTLSNCISSPFTAMWSVPTNVARTPLCGCAREIRQREH